MKYVEAIATAQKPMDDAEDNLNSLILSKRSLDMTVQELTSLGVDPKDVIAATGQLGKEISAAAVTLANAKIKGCADVLKVKQGRTTGAVTSNVESPIDYNRTQIKTMPLSADSIKMDAQYFSYDENQQSAQNTVANIKSYVASSTAFLGNSRSMEASSAAAAQVNSQIQNHDVAGTLVITAGCTHKNALLLAPFILDVDKAIRVWNAVFPSDLLKPDDLQSLVTIAKQANTSKEGALRILSGAVYGSSFVGMVHVLRSESTQTSQQMYSAANSLQQQMKAGGWFADSEGGFGVSASFANDVKRMLSMQQISSHVSLVTMGSIPTIKSNQIKIGVQQFADFDPAMMMDKLATLANATQKDQTSIEASAAAARTGNQMLAIQGSTVQNVMSGLASVDDGQNKMLDINSLMTAFEDYVDKALAGNIGVPINYYVKSITKSQLAQMWVGKYYPRYLQISGDDSGGGGGGGGGTSQAGGSTAQSRSSAAPASSDSAAPASSGNSDQSSSGSSDQSSGGGTAQS